MAKRAVPTLTLKRASSGARRIVFLGTPEVAATSLQILLDSQAEHKIEVVAVVTRPPARVSGPKAKLSPSPVHQLASTASVPTFTPERASDSTFLAAIASLAPDACVTAAYGNFLPQRFLGIPPFGTLNIHPSLLPRYRGAAPLSRCLAAGDQETGVSVVSTVLRMDAGPILSQEVVRLVGNEKSTELLPHLFILGTRLLLRTLPSVWDRTAIPTPQDESAATAAPKLAAPDARVDLGSESALSVHNKVRGFAGWPGVWTTWVVGDSDERRVKLITTTVISPEPDRTVASTEITLLLHAGMPALRAVCGDGSVLGILELQYPGKRVTDARSFANGLGGRVVRWSTPSAE